MHHEATGEDRPSPARQQRSERARAPAPAPGAPKHGYVLEQEKDGWRLLPSNNQSGYMYVQPYGHNGKFRVRLAWLGFSL